MSTTELAWFKSSYSGDNVDCVEVALSWHKSSYSGDNGDCVEVALPWHKSSHSLADGDCVEMSACADTVHVRDSKDKQGPQLALTPAAWRSFVSYASRG